MIPSKNTNQDPSAGFQSLYGREYFASYEPDSGAAYKKRATMYRQEYERIRAYVNSGRVLDVGCGLGEFLSIFEDGWEKYGADISPYALEAASSRGISTILPEDPDGTFDLVVFRGTLQHLDEPLSAIKHSIRLLKPGGYLVFLATPNAGSLCYRLFQELPMLSPRHNFVVISAKILRQILENLGLEVRALCFPYLDTPYASPFRDIAQFFLRVIGIRTRFPFWGNLMECYARKPFVPMIR